MIIKSLVKLIRKLTEKKIKCEVKEGVNFGSPDIVSVD